jgi:DNA-binding SARP family transcriptional activator/tetratricopeptide (TPR) repeat protein
MRGLVRHEIKLLGPWELRDYRRDVGIPPGQLRILLTSLALSANETVGVDRLAEQLWPERPPQRARDTLHIYVGRLRKLLGPGLIHTLPGSGYRFGIDRDAVDVLHFRDLLHQARRAVTGTEELTLLHSALRLWRGTPFADLYSTWLDREVLPRLTEEWFSATARRIELELSTGRPEPLIAELQDLVDQHPGRESLWLLLITALYRAGRRTEALEAYQRVRTALRDELGIEPGESLVRLQGEILLGGSPASDGPVSVDARPPTEIPRQLPHDVARFTGRDRELAMLDQLLANARPTTPTIISVDGAPGVGKTTLAVRWAHRVAHGYPDGQLYLNLRGYGPGEPLSPQTAAEMLLRSLGVDSSLIPSDMDARAALLRSRLSSKAMLILLDNARGPDQVRPLLPGTNGLVIVTSRSQLRGLSIRDGARRVTLHPFPPEQSVDFLAATLGERSVAREPAAAGELVELCDRLPLALAIVAERAQRAGSLARVVSELADAHARLDRLDLGKEASLRAALSWSYQALDADAAAMFRKLGVHPANDIDVATAAALADVSVPRAQATLDLLVAAHLVEQRRSGRYELHDLIRLYAGELAEQDTDRDTAIRRLLDWYLHTAANADRTLAPYRRRDFLAPYEPSRPPQDFETSRAARTWFDQEYECLHELVRSWAARNGYPGHAWRIAMTMTTFFDHAIPWRESLEVLRSAHAASAISDEPTGEAFTLNSLGCIYLDMSDWPIAQSHFERSYDRFRATSHYFGQAMTLGNIALAQVEQGRVKAAQANTRRALELYEQLDWPRGVALNLDNLGILHSVSGEHEQAIEFCQMALIASRHCNDHEIEAWSLLHLAQAYAQLRDFPNSTRAFRQAIAIYREHGNSRWAAILLNEFGTMLAEAGHPGIAHAMRRTALATLTEFADPRSEQIKAALTAP